MNKLSIRVAAAALALAAGSAFAAGHLSVSREMTVDSPPDAVWQWIGPFNSLKDWHPAVADSTMNGDGKKAGTTRTLTLKGGGTIEEKLLKSGKHSYNYAILQSPLPVKNYESKLSVSAAGQGKSKVKWSSTFDANGAPDDKAKEVIGGVYDGGLKNVADHFKK